SAIGRRRPRPSSTPSSPSRVRSSRTRISLCSEVLVQDGPNNRGAESMIDRSSMIARMRDALTLEPSRTVVVTIDCQRGNLDPALAPLPVPEAECARVIGATNRLLELARAHRLGVIHMATAFEACLMATHPFERAMLALDESFSPERKSD